MIQTSRKWWGLLGLSGLLSLQVEAQINNMPFVSSELSVFSTQPSDFDNDGNADILWRNATTGENWMYRMYENYILKSSPINAVTDLNWKVVGVHDFDDDGNGDILWRHAVTGENWLYLMDGNSIKASVGINTVKDLNWKVVGVADFDGDSKADILWRNATTGENWMYRMYGNSILQSTPINTVADLNWKVVGVADFDGDGNADIFWRHATTGENWMYRMNGASIQGSSPINTVTDLNWKVVGVADFDGDGKADILWRNAATGQNWMYRLFGSSILKSAAINTVADLSWKVVGVADFNGDGNTDILWRHATTGENWMYLMDGFVILKSVQVNTVADLAWHVELSVARDEGPKYTLYSNPDDPLLLKAETTDGDSIEYFGEKDSQGMAVSLNSVHVESSSHGPTDVMLDERGRPIQIFAPNGVVIKLTWVTDTLVLFTAITEDGAIQSNVSVDLTAVDVGQLSDASPLFQSAKQGLSGKVARGNIPVHAYVTNLEGEFCTQQLPQETSTDSNTVVVKVKKCNSPVNDANVRVRVWDLIDLSRKFVLPGKLSGPGEYRVSIPTTPVFSEETKETCDSVANVLGAICEVKEQLVAASPYACAALSAATFAAASAAAITALSAPIIAANVFRACEIGAAAAALYCNTLGEDGGLPPGAPDLADSLCKNINSVADRALGYSIMLRAEADIDGSTTYSQSEQPYATGPFPDLIIDAGSSVKITSFTTNPADPAPYQSYIATVEIACAPSGTQVEMSISGTDGYQNSATCTIEGNRACNLYVPGSSAGVADTISISLNGSLAKIITIVF